MLDDTSVTLGHDRRTTELAPRLRLAGLALVVAVALVFPPATALAHPAVSLVMDSRGNVYYSDLSRVWRIGTDGRKTVVVPGVHTHELYIDANDNLYGEHLWYEGEATDKWGHRVWRRGRDGRVTTVIPPTEGFLNNYSFIRDRTGTMYWLERGERTRIRKKTPDGRISVVSTGPFRDVRWMISSADGALYLIDSVDLKRVAPNGVVSVLARSIDGRRLSRFNVGARHAIMGLWLDSQGNVFAANYGAGVVKRIGPRGVVTTVARSRLPWSPTGGMSTANGDLWILEASVTNAVRVRRIAANGAVTTF